MLKWRIPNLVLIRTELGILVLLTHHFLIKIKQIIFIDFYVDTIFDDSFNIYTLASSYLI